MDLDQYMKKNKIKASNMAKELGLTNSFISKLRKKVAIPSLINGILISRYCKYQVTIVDLLSQKTLDAHFIKRGIPRFSIKDISNCL
jgi:transcriptional regulator with XRE-family HTH domain